MSNPHSIPERLQGATGLKAVLAAAYDAFEFLLAVIRDHQDLDEGLFAAFVMSGACAADGRDALAAAPSLRWPPPVEHAGAVNDFHSGSAGEIAADLAALSQQLATRLRDAATTAPDSRDRAECAEAAQCAIRIRDLLAGWMP